MARASLPVMRLSRTNGGVRSTGDTRAMQTDAVLEVVERRIHKAHERLDRHESRHSNLFFAYFDLKDEANPEERGED